MNLEEQLKQIEMTDPYAMEQARARWNSIAKPIGSLGKMESTIIQIAGITKNAMHLNLQKKAVLIFSADHGVIKEGVTQTDAQVTRIVTDNFAKGCSCVNVMADIAKADVFPIDIGMLGKTYPMKELTVGAVTDRKISMGSKNIAKEAAMTLQQCKCAIEVGIEAVRDLKEKGYAAIAVGEMGIGNTTPTSALAAIWLNQSVENVTGKGAGLSIEGYQRKLEVLRNIVTRHQKAEKIEIADTTETAETAETTEKVEKDKKSDNTENADSIIKTLSDIGGYDIAGMTGAFIGGAIYRIPILMDGVISAIAALAAVLIEPKVTGYILATHESKEPAGKLLLQTLHKDPMLQCDMHLGEGSGAVAAMPLLDMAVAVYEKMSTFEDNQIEDYIDYNQGTEQLHEGKE